MALALEYRKHIELVADEALDQSPLCHVNGGAKRDHLGGVRRDRLAAAGLSP